MESERLYLRTEFLKRLEAVDPDDPPPATCEVDADECERVLVSCLCDGGCLRQVTIGNRRDVTLLGALRDELVNRDVVASLQQTGGMCVALEVTIDGEKRLFITESEECLDHFVVSHYVDGEHETGFQCDMTMRSTIDYCVLQRLKAR
jgi:hypothetical protein